MAGSFQKTVENVTGVASVGSPVQTKSKVEMLGGAIDQAGEAVVKGMEEGKKADVRENLTSMGREVFALEKGEEDVLERAKDIDQTSERFKRLKSARDQGRMSQAMIDIETEKLVKETIGRNPFVGDEVRKEAARILGFDPTGSEIRNLFGDNRNPKEGSRALTAEEKIRAKAERTGKLLGLSADVVERNIYKAEYTKTLETAAVSGLKLGDISANQVLDTHYEGMDVYVNDAFGFLLTEMGTNGGVLKPESGLVAIGQAKEQFKQNYFNNLRKGGVVISKEDRREAVSSIDDRFKGIEEFFGDTATLSTILSRQKEDLASITSIIGMKAFPGMAAAKAALGERAVSEYISLLANVTDERVMKMLAKRNPVLSEIISNKGKYASQASAGMNLILGLEVDSAEIPDPTLVDHLSGDITKKSTDTATRGANLNHYEKDGRIYKAFGDYGRPGVRAKATAEEVSYIREGYALEKPILTNRISYALEENPGVTLEVTAGKIKVVSTGGAASNAPESLTTLMNYAQIPSGLEDDVKRLNSYSGLVNNGWANDLGEQVQGFAEGLVNQINGLSDVVGGVNEFDQAFEAASNNLSVDTLNALRESDPEAYAEALRSIQGE